MKKILLVLSSLCVLANTSVLAGGTKDLDKVRMSVYAGVSFNSLKPTASTSEKYAISKVKGNTGFLFGLSLDKALNDRYTVFSGLGLDWRGGSILAASTDSVLTANYLRSANVTYKMQYLTIPLGLKMKAAEFGDVKVYAQTGLDLAILLSQKGNYSGVLASGLPALIITNSKLNDVASVNPVNIGWSFGLGGEYNLGKGNSCYATLLYRNGIIDATLPKTNIDLYKFSDGNIRSNSFSLRVGYYF